MNESYKELVETFSTENVKFGYDNQSDVLCIKFMGKVKTEEYRRAMNNGVVVGKMTGKKEWLIDQRKMMYLSAEDIKWTIDVWYPIFMKELEKIEAVAFLIANNLFAELTTKSILDEITQRFSAHKPRVIRHFQQEAVALEWLHELNLLHC